MKIRTYKELEEWLELFKNKKINILIITSKAGLGKSEIVKETMKDTDYLYVNSHITPFSLYQKAYEFKDKPIVIDDIDTILENKEILGIIKQLSETRKIKKIQWNSSKFKEEEIPQEYNTSSNILLIGNRIKRVSSILNRGIYIQFEPTKEEVINRIKTIEKDKTNKEILKFMMKMDTPTLRHYFKALSVFSKDNEKWKKYIESDVPTKLLVCKKIIEEIPKNQWIRVWTKTGMLLGKKWTRQNFYYYYNKLKLKDIETIVKEVKNEVSNQQKNKNWTLDTFKNQKYLSFSQK